MLPWMQILMNWNIKFSALSSIALQDNIIAITQTCLPQAGVHKEGTEFRKETFSIHLLPNFIIFRRNSATT